MSDKVSDVIKNDHRELENYYNKIMDAKDADTRTRYQNQFTWELARHSIAEELVVYPAMEKYILEDGKDLAEKDRKEHRIVKEKLYKFQNLNSTDSEFEPTLKSLWEDLSEHIKEEENEDLPKLEESMVADASEHMAKKFERTKIFVPTRSHPAAPDRPPFETVMGLMAAPIDKLGDMLRKYPDRT